jgi:hypothetical protein
VTNTWVQRVLLVLLVLALSACAGPGSSTAAVELGEFWVTPDIRVLKAGAIELVVENYGEFPHTLVVSDASGTVIAATDLINPEAETVLTVSLEPGVYMFTCRIVKGLEDGTVIDHYQQGMAASIEVVG